MASPAFNGRHEFSSKAPRAVLRAKVELYWKEWLARSAVGTINATSVSCTCVLATQRCREEHPKHFASAHCHDDVTM